MPATLTDQKRTAIAEKLADIKAIQNLIIDSEQEFLSQCSDDHLRRRLEDMLEDDQKNLDIVETAITQYGIQAEPKPTVQEFVSQAKNTLSSSRLSMYEKIAQHELLKHGQVMSGLVVHKAAQIVGQDVEAAIAPLNTVNFENRAHQEQLKGMLEYLGTLELTGQEPQQGLWARVQDAVAAATGIVGSAVTQTSDKESADVIDLLFMDHQKARTLISEIRNADNEDQIKALFGQLYKDLMVHAKAEEAVVYPAVQPFYGNEDTQELYDETVEVESVLNELKAMPSTGDQFMAKLKELKAMLGHHIRGEESTMFAAIRKNMSSEEQQQLGMQFKESKQSLQSQM
ncbi:MULTISPECIES: hemerythrin domain-containing protein [Cyanophyceae]|uniref:hemerythrin domain-containing protein n=1 Tax=Cyanophyceae TaxID=3028117 RepID=UPI0016854D16|nr:MULTISPECIES: hemerythrin domain-containing protein [Cyanophyceae]MBD1915705.1 hemerythrin domain-containing protein [Phormidium sp. FACHB-77]MBD2029046.1 hemerythrin domain-containing protein [Phormidium sp. FACHB-322]MBD2052197.1 hemerythrin domain-containing protein [Leptolyngbya sp. FACHB-60]